MKKCKYINIYKKRDKITQSGKAKQLQKIRSRGTEYPKKQKPG